MSGDRIHPLTKEGGLPDLAIEDKARSYEFLAQALFRQNPDNTTEIVQAWLASLTANRPVKGEPEGEQWVIAYRLTGDMYLGDDTTQRTPENLQQAQTLYERALEFDDNNVLALEQLSRVHAHLQHWEMAKQTHQRALDANLQYRTATLNQKQAQLQFFLGQQYQALGNTKSAIAAYHQAVEFDPELALAYEELGRLYAHQKQNKLAFKALHNHLRVEEANDGISYGSERARAGLAYARLGALFDMQNDWKNATKAYRQSIRLQGAEYESLFEAYALTLLKLNRDKQALAAYLKYFRSSPFYDDRTPAQREALAYQSLGDDLARLQNFAAANQAYEAALQRDSTVAPSLHYQAEYLIAKDDIESAIALYESANQQKFHSGDWSTLGKLYVQEGRRDKALNAFRESNRLSVEYNPKMSESELNAKAFIEIGHALSRSQTSHAIQAYQEAIALQPSWLHIYGWIGQIQWDQGQEQLAIESFQKALQQQDTQPKWRLAMFHNSLGLLLLQQRQYSEALGAFQKAVSLEQNNHEYRLNLEQAQNALEFEQAEPPSWNVMASAQDMQGQIDSILGIAGLGKGPMPPTPTPELRQYRQHWAQRDATIAPWLGHWVNRDLFTPFYEVDVYPSEVPGRVCMISRQLNHVPNYSVLPGEQVLPNDAPQFSILQMASSQLYGQHWVTHERLRQQSQNPLTGEPIEFLGLLDQASTELRIYAAQSKPSIPTFWPMAVQKQWEAYQCRSEEMLN